MTRLIALDDRTLVAGQIAPGDMAQIAAAGVTLVINNRPDGEEAGQPTSAEIEAAARASGLDYRFIPIAGGIAAEQVLEMADALATAGGQTFAFCRSGTRSTFLWALARASQGADSGTLISQAGAAGYDLAPIRPYLV